jgi:small-conductance mechanosensitive channel
MPAGWTQLGGLAALVETPAGRTLVTLLLVAALAGALLAVERSGPLLGRWLGEVATEAVQAVTIVATLAAAVWAVVTVWGATERVTTALTALDADASLVVLTGVVVAGAYALSRIARRILGRIGDRSDAVSDHRRAIALRLVQLTIYVLALLLVFSLWRVDLGNLLIGAGVIGIVLGLAARQTLGTALAGFVVLFSRPFEVGDWVVVNDQEGVVRDITLANTRIETFDDECVVVPNDVVTGTEVVNKSQKGRLRVEVEVGVDYGADPEAAVDAAEEAMRGLDELRETPSPHVVADGFGDSAIRLRCRCWIDDPTARRYWRARTAVVSAVWERFEAEEITIPVPRRSLGGSIVVEGPVEEVSGE